MLRRGVGVGVEEWMFEGFLRRESLARLVDEQLLDEVKQLLVLWVSCDHVPLDGRGEGGGSE